MTVLLIAIICILNIYERKKERAYNIYIISYRCIKECYVLFFYLNWVCLYIFEKVTRKKERKKESERQIVNFNKRNILLIQNKR